MSIRLRNESRHKRSHAFAFTFMGLFGFVALLTITLFFSLAGIVSNWLTDLPDFTDTESFVVTEPSVVMDSTGTEIATFFDQNKQIISMYDVSPYVLAGTVDTEDVRFYQHNGIDPTGIARALLSTISGSTEGASTITQQLVRNTVLADEQFDISIKRKVREAYLAIQMEKKYSKDQILDMYLNTIYYGNSCYGIESAAHFYFSKSAKELTLAESALLVGIPNSPSANDPFTHPNAAKERRNLVLDRMVTAGDITQQMADEAKAQPLGLHKQPPAETSLGTYPYWTQYIKSLLAENLSSDMIMKGGLRVFSTLDPKAQAAAEKAVVEQLNALGLKDLESALVAIEPSTGYIKAMVAGRDYNKRQINLATQGMRQPGSAFKMFTLADALSQGMNPDITLNCDSPLKVSPTWTVKNYGGISYGNLSLTRATTVSANTGYVQVSQAVGANSVVKMAHSMGITEDLPAYDSLTLGTINVPVIQMAEAYATLPAGGLHRDSVAITKIEDRNGNVVYEHKDDAEQVLDPKVAAACTDVLETVINGGDGATGAIINTYGINQPLAGKTGTTEYADNLWFCGYSPQLSVAVWTGYPDSSKEVRIGGTQGHPSNTSCPIFGKFLKEYLDGVPRQEFPNPGKPSYKPNSMWSFSGTSG